MNNPQPRDEDTGKIVIDFIDPIFAVVLHISFVEVLLEAWFGDFRLIFREPYKFEVASLLLAYATIVFSWIGYHRSIRTKPINVNKISGQARFFSDIALLIGYFVLVVSFKNFQRELWVLVVIYVLFVCWDQFKRLEHPETDEDSSARRGVTVFWLLIFLSFALFYRFYPPSVPHECEDWIVLVALFVATLLYRVHKDRLTWKPLLLVLGFPRFHG